VNCGLFRQFTSDEEADMLRSRLPTAVAVVAGMICAANVQAVTIIDNYLGQDSARPEFVAPTKDVLGSTAVNQVSSADLSSNGKDLVVTINTSFWDGYHNYHYGDLFLSTHGYTPPLDSTLDNGDGTGKWDFVFVTSSQTLYQITPDFVASKSLVRDNPTFFNANPGAADPTKGTHWVSRASGGNLIATLSGAFQGNPVPADPNNPSSGTSITYAVPLADLGPPTNGQYDIGMRWTQTCGNDIIEGGATIAVPEGNTAWLLLGGLLLGGWAIRRRTSYAVS
jgi:hypothetical protein